MAKPKISFEKALEMLETIVSEIEEGRTSLEESIDKYAEGTKLIKQCRQILDAAEKKIQVLARDEADKLQPAGELSDEANETDDPGD
jgi:exodeoxyribonuclease VII small subunit